MDIDNPFTSFISVGNSSTTNLDSSNSYTFTGDWVRTLHPDAMVNLVADQVCTMLFQFSLDGVTVDSTLTKLTTANINEFSTIVKGARYFRVVVSTNSLTTTTFRLQTQFGVFRAGNAPQNLSLALDADALAVRPSSFQDEVTIGRRSGVTGWNKFGYRTSIQINEDEATIWATSGNYTPPTSADTYTITYTNTSDGAGGSATGAEQLTFYHIDENGLPEIQVHTLGSDGSDETSFSGLGINRIAVSASGTAKSNVAAITVTHTTSGDKMAIVPAPVSPALYQGVTQQCIFHVGSNHTAAAKLVWGKVAKLSGSSPLVIIKGYVYNRGIDTFFEVFRDEIDTSKNPNLTLTDPVNFRLNATDVLFFTADTDTNNTNVELRFSVNEYQNS